MIIGETTVHQTRYPELGYTDTGIGSYVVNRYAPKDRWIKSPAGSWRFVDTSTGAHVGPYYVTKIELLQDLDRYAGVFGCEARP